MKRLTAMVLAVVLLLVTACGSANLPESKSASGSGNKGIAKGKKGDTTITLYDLDDSEHRITTWPEGSTGQVAAVVTEGRYAMSLFLIGEDEDDILYYLYSENGWENYDYEGFEDRIEELDLENLIKVGSGERKELKGPAW